MNKDLYRLIYNRALRLWQVASERATPPAVPPVLPLQHNGQRVPASIPSPLPSGSALAG
nr:ESPR domain-containing protein [Xylella fastidiosa]